MVLFFYSCGDQHESNYPWIGFIDPSSSLSNNGFQTCADTVFLTQNMRYYFSENSAGYYGGYSEIKRLLLEKYNGEKYTDSGYLTIRFILNCRGETGRFVMNESSIDFNDYSFNQKLKNELLAFTMKLDQWRSVCYEDENEDAYVFLTYKIINGEIVEILP